MLLWCNLPFKCLNCYFAYADVLAKLLLIPGQILACHSLPLPWTRCNQSLLVAYPKHNLVKDIRTETSGDYRDALLQILEGTLDEPSAVKLRRLRPETVHEITNPLVAETYAEEIHKSGERCPDAVKAMYMRTIITRSPWQIYALDQAYLKTYGSSVTSAIKKGTTGSFKHFLQARVTYALDRPTFYAKLFHFAIAGPGTKDATLQRILALRADVDLQSIKERYELLYGETLLQAISEDTSREYRKLCIQLATECNNV
uniref:Annexin n=1 Tax=Mesocestoides corti TaxID=53468 RepID=A0A5K3FZA6_MESCO